MSETREAGQGVGAGVVDDDLSPTALLASIRSARVAEDAAAARQLSLAARWADLHPPESIDGAATFSFGGSGLGREHEEPIAGDGCPLVAEFCVAELGTVLGISTMSAKKLIGHALSSATASPASGPRSTPAGCPPGGPGRSPKRPSTPLPP